MKNKVKEERNQGEEGRDRGYGGDKCFYYEGEGGRCVVLAHEKLMAI